MFFPPANLTTYYKYGPKPDDATPQWYEFVHYHPALPGAEILPGTGFVEVRLFLCDAQLGDDVAVEDSSVIDQGGPGGTTAVQIQVSPAALDFGDVTVGNVPEQVVTVTSVGSDDLVLGNIGAGHPLSAPFSITSDNCSGVTLASGNNCQIQVQFNPTATGSFSDHFDIPSNDPNANPVDVTVQGAGVVSGVPDIGLTANQLNFGTISSGSSSVLGITIRNDGNANLVIGNIGQNDSLASPFSLARDGCSGQTLSPAGQCEVQVRFSPTRNAAFNDTFDIPSNDPDENPVTITVQGEAQSDFAVPGMGGWGMLLLTVLLGASAWLFIRTRRYSS